MITYSVRGFGVGCCKVMPLHTELLVIRHFQSLRILRILALFGDILLYKFTTVLFLLLVDFLAMLRPFSYLVASAGKAC